MEWLLFSKLSIQAFTQLVLSLMITIYLAFVRDKSVPTKILVVFFSLFTLNIVPDLVQVEDEENIYVQIDDTGRGIPQQELDAIFDFGFRIDARVKLGAGLSTAYRIVQDHGGQIQIESQVGAGTQVQIALPKRDRRIAAA